MSSLADKLGNSGEILEGFLQSRIIPKLEGEAGSQRKVRTGTYSGTWAAEQVDEDSAQVTTDAEYWVWLEFGNSRGLVGKPVVGEAVAVINSELGAYLAGALTV